MRDFDQSWRNRLTGLQDLGRLRRLTAGARLPDGRIDRGQGPLLDFSSNDYLGLARHPEVKRRAQAYIEQWGAGSGASRLVTGNLPPFVAIERKIADAKAAEAALILVSGFQANATVLPALLDRTLWEAPPLVFSDRLNHASLIQGCKLSAAEIIQFQHNDMTHLETLLRSKADGARPCFIVTETVFSMDGDRADLAALSQLAGRFDAFLYLDEAHATGVLGPHGAGLAHGLAGGNCLVMGTFSKALGSFGAYVACSATLKEFLVNRCAGLIYATALPPAMLGAMDAALDLLPGFDSERERLAGTAERFRQLLRQAGEDCGPSSTQIVPLLVGAEDKAMALAESLQREGMLALAIRPPTVPPGSSRLRFAFAAYHGPDDVDRLVDCLVRIRKSS